MSEMKPVAWEHRENRILQYAIPMYGTLKGNYISPGYTPLYTADQLAEAVAAERERCAKVCKDARLNEISAPADWHNDACEACIHAIRSAAK